jgi:hypothetical protein
LSGYHALSGVYRGVQKENALGKKIDDLRHVFLKLSKRYGTEDVDVQRLQTDLSALEKYECLHPERIYSKRTNLDFQSPAKRMYYAESARQGEFSLSNAAQATLS